jgi:putative ABC transport system permease protein
LPGVAQARFLRSQPLWLKADRAPVTLVARDFGTDGPAQTLPVVMQSKSSAPRGAPSAWISEAVADKYGYHPGDSLALPLAGTTHWFFVAGIWRDYARPDGAIVISRDVYSAATGDYLVNEGSVWRRPQVSPAALEASIREALPLGDALDLIGSSELRERSLTLFDRAFAITYALEFIAVAIGLAGIGVAASSSALARRAQFGMLRHVGMLRRQVLAMLAGEGVIMSTLSVIYGLMLGLALSLILVYVINRQSFNWSIDLAVPWGQLTVLSLALILASALTALWSGRSAMSLDVVRAVREDW